MPARAGQAAARPGRPRSTARVRVKELTRAMQREEALQHRGQQVEAAALPGARSNSSVTSRPRQKAPDRARPGRAGGCRGCADTPIRASIAARVSARLAQIVEPQHLPQRWRPPRAAGHRQMARATDARPAARNRARATAGATCVVGAVRQSTRATVGDASTRRKVGRPPPNGRSAGRSRLRQSASTDSTASVGGSGSNSGSYGAEEDLGAGSPARGGAARDAGRSRPARPASDRRSVSR